MLTGPRRVEVLMRSVPPLGPWRLLEFRKRFKNCCNSPRCRESMQSFMQVGYNLDVGSLELVLQERKGIGNRFV